MPHDYASFASAFHAHRTQSPNQRAALGLTERLGELPDPSVQAAEARFQRAEALREAARRLRGADLTGSEQQTSGAPRLDFDQALDLELAELALSAEVLKDRVTSGGGERLRSWPSAGDDLGDGLFGLFINDPRPAAERLADAVSKLEAVPDYLASLLGRLERPVARWVAMDQSKVSGLPELFGHLEAWSASEAFADHERLVRAGAKAQGALTSYHQRLGELPSTPDIHVGEEAAEAIIRSRGVFLSPAELHGVAKDFLKKIAEQLEVLRGRLVSKYDLPKDTTEEALQQFLAERYRVPLQNGKLEDILTRYQAERERILGFIRERELFPIPEDQDMLILRTPSFLTPTIPAGAMTSPPPFRSGTKRSLVYLTLSEELVAEHTELSIPGMMIHEGIPGHHLQLSWGALHSSVIRRHIDAMDHAEGWTTMLEDYMLDVGYAAELADEVRFSTKRDIARIGARVAIDLFFMSGNKSYLEVGVKSDLSPDDPFVAAGNLLAAVTGFVPGRVQAELNWYSQERGYPLSYLAGNHLVWQLKRDLEAAQTGRLAGATLDREFHRVYLESGNMPVAFLRRVFEHQGLLGAG